jgi:hypothetical protein
VFRLNLLCNERLPGRRDRLDQSALPDRLCVEARARSHTDRVRANADYHRFDRLDRFLGKFLDGQFNGAHEPS